MNMKIVVCDDDQMSLEQIKELLLAYGKEKEKRMEIHTYMSAEELQAALEEGDQTEIDLLLLDIVLEGKNGIELAEAIRSKNKDMPIVFVTSSTEFAIPPPK